MYTANDLDTLGEMIGKLAVAELVCPSSGRPGQILSDRHEELTHATARVLAHLAGGRILGRHCISSPVGLGKTQSIKAAMAVLGHETPDLVLLSLHQKVDAGREVAKEVAAWMAARGWAVPEDLLGHVHSQPGGLAPSAASARRFVIATHERSRRESIASVALYRSAIMRPCIVDEALYSSWAHGCSVDALHSAHVRIKAALADRSVSRRVCDEAMVAWIEPTLIKIRARVEIAQCELLQFGRVEASPAVDLQTIEDDDLRKEVEHRLKHDFGKDGRLLGEVLTSTARSGSFHLAVKAPREGADGDAPAAFLQHRRTLPADLLRNAIIFDAGAEVDRLLRLDDGIELIAAKGARYSHMLPAWAQEDRSLRGIKSWAAVDVWHMARAGGKDKMHRHFAGRPSRKVRKAVAEDVAEFIVTRCADAKRILVCIHKDSQADEWIALALADRGVDPRDIGRDVDSEPDPEERFRIEFTHWGLHDALNCWNDADAVIAVGGWTVSDDVARAQALGQIALNRVNPETPDDRVKREVQRSRVSTSLYQLAGRGRARNMEDGRALPMLFAFIYDDRAGEGERVGPIVRDLRHLMPGAQWRMWVPVDATKRERGAEAVLNVLERWRLEGRTRGAIRTLWAEVPPSLRPASRDARRVILREVEERQLDWSRQASSMVYLPAW